LMRRTRLKEDQLRQVIELIQSLNPRPGGEIASGDAEYVIPDVIVRRDHNSWIVELNQEAAPRVRVNTHYAPWSSAPTAARTTPICATTCRRPAGSSRACRAATRPCSRWQPRSSNISAASWNTARWR